MIWENLLRLVRQPTLLCALGAAILLGVFGFVAEEVGEGETQAFDQAVTQFFREPGNPADPWGPQWLEEAIRDLTSLGSFSVLGLIVLASVLYLLLARRFRTALFVAIAVCSGTALSNGLKALFNRPRPDVEASAHVFTASFPSGHATLSAVVYLTLGALLAQTSRSRAMGGYMLGLAVFITLLVGLTRIYLGMHFPTDVLAGWSLGTAWALLCWIAIKLFPTHDGPEA